MTVYKLHRIKEIADEKGRSLRWVAIKAGLSQNACIEMVKRNRGEILNIMKIAKVLEVSIDELVENTDMNISGDITGIKSGLETIRAITTTLKSKPARKGLIPLLTFDIMSQSLLKDLLKNASEVQGYLIPNVPDADFIVQMPGQAMSPKYEPGDMLICKYRETGVLIEPIRHHEISL